MQSKCVENNEKPNFRKQFLKVTWYFDLIKKFLFIKRKNSVILRKKMILHLMRPNSDS